MATCKYESLSDYNWSPGKFEVLAFNPVVYPLVASFFAVALWLSLELTVQLYFKFRRHRGLYFWSILIVSCGVALHTIGLIVKLFTPGGDHVGLGFAKVGWIMNTTGFSVVLYSRLHLIVQNRNTLRLVLVMIIVDAVIFHTPIIVLLTGLSYGKDTWGRYIDPFEYTQVIGFTIQETIIASIYMFKTAKFLKSGYSHELKKFMFSLIAVQVVVVLIDIAMISIDCFGYFTLKAAMHPFTYAVKLKIEFAVLNLLLGMIKKGPSNVRIPAGSDLSESDSPAPSPPRRASIASMRAWLGQKKASDLPRQSQDIIKKTEFEVCWTPRDPKTLPVFAKDIQWACEIPPQQSQPAVTTPNLVRQDSDDTLYDDISADETEINLDDIEKQYLGRYGLHRPGT